MHLRAKALLPPRIIEWEQRSLICFAQRASAALELPAILARDQMTARAGKRKQTAQPGVTNLAPCSAHDDGERRRSSRKCSQQRSGPGHGRVGDVRSRFFEDKSKQAGNCRDKRRQIDAFRVERKKTHAAKQDASAENASDKIADKPPSRGRQLGCCSKHAKCRQQDDSAQLCHEALSTNLSSERARMMTSRQPQNGHAPQRRNHAMRRFGENCLPHSLHSASVQMGKGAPEISA